MCPTCSHAVQRVNEGTGPVTWWCPRCGTLKIDKGVPESERPTYLRTVVQSLDVHKPYDGPSGSDPSPLAGCLWGKVAHVFALGSTSANKLCIALGFDPDNKPRND